MTDVGAAGPLRRSSRCPSGQIDRSYRFSSASRVRTVSLSAAALGLASPRGGPWGRDLRTGAGPNAPLGLRHGRRRRAGGLKRIKADNFSDIVGRSSDQARALKVHGTKSRDSARARQPAGDFGRPAYGLRIPSAALGPRFGATRGGGDPNLSESPAQGTPATL